MYGVPGDLKKKASVDFDVRTESEDDGTHAIFFNRGVVASQAYANRFDNKPPHEVGPEAYQCLRGLFEAMDEFIGQAKNSWYAIRAAVYEFTHRTPSTLSAERPWSRRGDPLRLRRRGRSAREEQPDRDPLGGARRALRTTDPGKDRAQQVHRPPPRRKAEGGVTGSTNFTEGGIYGHSNLGHIVRSPRVAARYVAYWKQLRSDPKAAVLRDWTEQETVILRATPSSVDLRPSSALAAASERSTGTRG